METITQSKETGGRFIERLAYNERETRQLLGGISRPTLWRLEKRELIKPSRALRTKLYPRAEIERFLDATK